MEKLTQVVNDKIDEAAKIIRRWREDDFHREMWCDCMDGKMGSPIEEILYVALKTIDEINPNPPITIHPQKQFDKYRVDFEVLCDVANKSVVVECDSQQFHERTEKERRHEKARDRYFSHNHIIFFHYTGKEIIEDPFKIACEIIAYLTEDNKDELYDWYREFDGE